MVKKTGLALLVTGSATLALSLWGLAHDIGWISVPFYAYAWWSYILIVDGFAALRRGSSLLTTRRRFLGPIALWSVTFWFFFELLNVRFQNWYYIGVPPVRTSLDALSVGVFTFLCFATVFTGIFETCDALAASGLWRSWRGRQGRLPSWASYAVQALGAAMAAAAILFPEYLAPLIWGSLTFLLDPWNHRRGARSILSDFEARNWGVIARFFAAGLLCGIVWESFNFFAPQKWIYTVRGLERVKLFEMPVAGFLGFPALAFDSLACFSFLSWLFLGNESWEHADDLSRPLVGRGRPERWIFLAAVPLQIFFWGYVAGLSEVNIGSLQVELSDLGLRPAERAALTARGIERPKQLLRTASETSGRDALFADLGWSQERGMEVLDETRLLTFKGIGREFGALLQRVGVHRVEDLRDWKPEALHSCLRDEAQRLGQRAPRLDMVRVWVFASADQGVFLVSPTAKGRPGADGFAPRTSRQPPHG